MRPTLLFLVSLLFALEPAARVIRVNPDATGRPRDGSAWDQGIRRLDQALARAQPGDELWIREGTYRVGADSHFVLVNRVDLYGGFVGTESSREGRTPSEHRTVLAYTRNQGVPLQGGVLYAHGVTATLDGLTLFEGEAFQGGGLYAEESDLTLRQVVIEDGRANQGGGVYVEGGTLRLFDSVLFSNAAGLVLSASYNSFGGGLYVREASLIVIASRFVENGSYGISADGGGLYSVNSSVLIVSSEMRENRTWTDWASGRGGAISATGSVLRVVSTSFEENLIRSYEGMRNAGIAVWFDGGGLQEESWFSNVLFDGNKSLVLESNFVQGVVFVESGELGMDHVTVVRNGSRSNPLFMGNVRLAHSVVWGNGSPSMGSEATAEHSLIQGGAPGEGIIDADPLFVAFTSSGTPGDFRLQPGSPAIDAGLASLLPPDVADLDGDGNTTEPLPMDLDENFRVWGAAPDFGAYEYGAPPVASEPEPVDRALSLVVTPNPARGDAAALVRLAAPAEVEVAVYDARGRRVGVLHTGVLPSGETRIPISSASLPAGVYLVRVAGPEGARAVPFTLLR